LEFNLDRKNRISRLCDFTFPSFKGAAKPGNRLLVEGDPPTLYAPMPTQQLRDSQLGDETSSMPPRHALAIMKIPINQREYPVNPNIQPTKVSAQR
jgi:hypothetical protein